MTTNNEFKVAIIGPSRVGKTSLITALFEETQTWLLGKPVKIRATGATEQRLRDHLDDLRGAIAHGKFNAGALGGTESSTQFDLELIADGASKRAIHFSILDFPGGWLHRSEGRDEREWEACQEWIKDSSVLLVPIDATVLMEAATHEQAQQRIRLLQLSATIDVALMWANGRCEKNERSLLVLAPVKCESYFNDNGGTVRKGEALYNEVMHDSLYKDLVKKVREVFERWHEGNRGHNLEIQYHPIDTVGCVEIESVRWNPEFSASYRVRQKKRGHSPYGAGGILVGICRQLVEARTADMRQQATSAAEHANRDRSFITRIWEYINGQHEKDQARATELTAEHSRLQNVIEGLAKEPFTNRVKMLKAADYASGVV